MKTKVCSKCQEERPVSQFYRDKSKGDGKQSNCIPCKREAKGITHREKVNAILRKEREKEREKAKKLQGEFNDVWRGLRQEWTKLETYKEWVKQVNREKAKQWYKDNPEKVRAKQKRWADANRERVRESNKKWREKNKDTLRKRKRDYRLKNREKNNERNRRYRKKNKERIAEREKVRRSTPEYKKKAKAYYQKNRERCLNASKEWHRAWKKTPIGVLRNRLSSRLWSALSEKGYTKKSRSAEIIGCSWPMLRGHIQNQFTKGMSWENRGDWHIDHIIPLASAKNEEELLKLSHFSNLQPLWAKDNLAKRDKILECQPELTLKY